MKTYEDPIDAMKAAVELANEMDDGWKPYVEAYGDSYHYGIRKDKMDVWDRGDGVFHATFLIGSPSWSDGDTLQEAVQAAINAVKEYIGKMQRAIASIEE